MKARSENYALSRETEHSDSPASSRDRGYDEQNLEQFAGGYYTRALIQHRAFVPLYTT